MLLVLWVLTKKKLGEPKPDFWEFARGQKSTNRWKNVCLPEPTMFFEDAWEHFVGAYKKGYQRSGKYESMSAWCARGQEAMECGVTNVTKAQKEVSTYNAVVKQDVLKLKELQGITSWS